MLAERLTKLADVTDPREFIHELDELRAEFAAAARDRRKRAAIALIAELNGNVSSASRTIGVSRQAIYKII